MKLIGSRWRERVGKPGLIENEQRVVRTLFDLWIVSGEGADAGILSEMPGSVGHQRVGRQLQRLLGLLYRRQIAGSRHLLRANAPAVVVLTLCGQVSFPLTLYIGLQTTSALNAAIYMSATPSMVLLINRLFFRDPVSGRNWLGVAFSTLGVMILLFQGNPLHAASLHTFAIGDLWAMGSALSWALYCSLLRLKDRRIPANGFVAVSSLLGALILLPIVIFWLMRHPAQDWAAWREPFYLSGLAYLVIFPSWLAYLFWNKGIATIGATRGEIYTHIIPLSGGVLSILFLHTQPQAWHLFSALFIMVGIGICSLEKRQAASIRLRD
ncbi:drug/metabolite transporter permease [Klebsiella pneumoniae subsp. rhinoscleromatis]|nr:drug/metabolite transporter permease [Klebsiella pneumoniae]STV50044.1 drug/metabolite transporter permease [Klebsiella pneumoniae subsp. rhinoscleromatis]VTT32073.1 drug/metabolite transporter permease [Klebsiella pneumoniae]